MNIPFQFRFSLHLLNLTFLSVVGFSITLFPEIHGQEILSLNGVPDAGTGLDGRYWQAGIKSIDNLDDKGGEKDIGLKLIRAAQPSGVFRASGLTYQGGNDLTPIEEWLQDDGASYVGAEGNMDDGLLSLTGYIRIDTPGERDIRSESDDGSIIWIAGTRTIDNDGSHGAPGPSPDGFYDFKTAGLYPIEIAWFNGDWTNDAGEHGGANLNILLDGETIPEEILYGASDVGLAAIAVSSIASEAGAPGLAGKYWTSEPKGFEFGEGAQGAIFQPLPGDDHGIILLESEPQATFLSSNVNYTGNDLTPILDWLGEDGASFDGEEGDLDDGMIQLRGLIQIETAGWHDFQSASDDGSVLWIGNQVVVNNDGGHGAPGPQPDGSAFFTRPGLYPIELAWFNGDWTNDGGDHGGASIDLTMDEEPLEGIIFQSLEEAITLPGRVKTEPKPLLTTLLESFETVDEGSIEDLVLGWNGDRTEYGVADLAQDSTLSAVTDGYKALEVTFDTLSGWAQDFQIQLNPEASSKLKAAWEDPSPHRWWLLYDITFGQGGGGWANNPVWIGPDASHGDQVEANGTWDDPVTAFIEMDAVRNGNDLVANEDGRIAIGFGFNGDLSQESKLWVDNIRLLDTYAPGFEPVETLIDGLEGPEFDLIVEAGYPLFDYTKQEDEDPRVTQGKGAAWIEVEYPEWTTAAVLELSRSEVLAETLSTIAPEDRVHYVLSYDFITIPGNDASVGWFQFIPQAPGLRLSPNVSMDTQRTTSINLASVPWEASNLPNINLITQGGFDDYLDIFVDHVRLFNAKGIRTAEPEPMSPPRVASAQLVENQFQVSFSSVAGGNYSVLSSGDLTTDDWSEAATGIIASGEMSTWRDPSPLAGQQFYRVRRDK
jgi:hypothetical protein